MAIGDDKANNKSSYAGTNDNTLMKLSKSLRCQTKTQRLELVFQG